MKQRTIIAISLAVILIIIGSYYLYNHYFLYTRQAYVEANVVNIAPQVAGKVATVYVHDLEKVRAGQKLFSLKASSYQQHLQLATAKLAIEKNAYLQAKSQNQQDKLALAKSQDNANYLQKEWQRYSTLAKQHVVSQEKADQIHNRLKQAKAVVASQQQAIEALQTILGNKLSDYAPYRQALANQRLAAINLKRTTVHSPVSGYITAMGLRAGTYVKVGQPLFSIIDNSHWWIMAAVKETDLFGIKAGDKATIYLPNMEPITSKVYGIAWGVDRRQYSASAMQSPLPYLPKSVNWIQLAQRFPVVIKLSAAAIKHDWLRYGMTAHVVITRG